MQHRVENLPNYYLSFFLIFDPLQGLKASHWLIKTWLPPTLRLSYRVHCAAKLTSIIFILICRLMESRSEIVQTKVSFSQQIRKVKEEMELAKGSLTEALNEMEKKWY